MVKRIFSIENWAETLGRELWNLGIAVTSKGDIYNVSIMQTIFFHVIAKILQNYQMVKLENKDPQKIITEIVGNVSYMMNKKMEAVRVISNNLLLKTT